VLDVAASRRVLGPMWLGAWARRDALAPRELRYSAGLALAWEW